ncbi:small ribosomal subunit Rsm22 family protein [Haloarcula sp. Atlit-120R]|uniref:small ribosomal subunit Rsm22 family protein n=1 Tax=Haloarcula sp. Atlit-120R TaxID=2282135 RepID=UPI000EF1A55C|nr:class I SAM-dependent methyltransferase [Haloarcula sp. Atlit-120R]RLM37230.1 class I SAM-dependent methyltransferase [Haloarcula sp. Atlit-120R]
MNQDTRKQIRDNAQYLRNVRPLDPEELHEYVEGQPHPAVVRQVLREEAFDLGLVEREDGTFVPAPEERLSVTFDGVDRFPDRYEQQVIDLLTEWGGLEWHSGDSGDQLRERIRDIKERYLRGQAVEYDELTALGYAVYHLPDYYAVAKYVLADLAVDGLLPSQLRVLDVGAGVGGPALALRDLLPDDALLDYHAVEPSAAADVLEHLLEDSSGNVRWEIHRETAEAFDPASPFEGDGSDGTGDGNGDAGYDLVIFGNVLSELDDAAATLYRYVEAIADDGTLLALAPADRNTAIQLRTVEREVADGGPATVYGPTVRLWPHQSPDSESWSFDRKPDIAVPTMQKRLDDAGGGTGEFVNTDVQFAYSVLRTDGKRTHDVTPDRGIHAPMADAENYVTDRVNFLGVKLSHDLAEREGANPLYLLGDGSQQVDHFAVLTEASILNEDLRKADYGDLLSFENALVLWNDDEEAYNVVVDGETVVDRAR